MSAVFIVKLNNVGNNKLNQHVYGNYFNFQLFILHIAYTYKSSYIVYMHIIYFHINIAVDGKSMEQIKSFRYLGRLITWKNRSYTEEIRNRITMDKMVLGKVRRLVTARSILRKRFAKGFTWQ